MLNTQYRSFVAHLLPLHLRQIVLPRATPPSNVPVSNRNVDDLDIPLLLSRGRHPNRGDKRPVGALRSNCRPGCDPSPHNVVVGDGGGNWGAPIGPRLGRRDHGGGGSWRVPRGAPLPGPLNLLGRLLSMADVRERTGAPVPPHAAIQ